MKVRWKGKTEFLMLTHGKIYTVIGVEKDWYRIIDDSGDDYLYPPEPFDIVDDQGNGVGDSLQLDIGGTSFLFEVAEIGSCNTKDYDDLDYWLVIKVEIRNRFVHYRCQGEYLEYRDIISIRDNLSRLLSGQLSEIKELSFTEPDFELALYPKDEINKRPGYWRRDCRDICVDFVINFYDDGYNGESYILPLDEDETALFRDYLDKAVVAFDARNMTNKSIKDVAYCTKCYSTISEQPGFETNDRTWTCAVCGQLLYGDEIANAGNRFKDVIWYCDGCGAILNRQVDFDDSLGSWECAECGFRNSISSDEIFASEQFVTHEDDVAQDILAPDAVCPLENERECRKNELLTAIDEITKYGLYPNVAVPDKEQDIEKNLAKIYSLYFNLEFEYDDTAYPDCDSASEFPNVRECVRSNFPNFNAYKEYLDICDLDDFSDYACGDAADDLSDIIDDLLEVRWRVAHNSLADGLWQFKFDFYAHTQRHILGLLLYLKEKNG